MTVFLTFSTIYQAQGQIRTPTPRPPIPNPGAVYDSLNQKHNEAQDSIRNLDGAAAPTDSPAVQIDSVQADTTSADSFAAAKDRVRLLEDSLGIKISKDALPSVVKAESVDSAVLDMKNNLFYLYGKAQVHYEDMNLTADQINYAQANDLVTAHAIWDSSGRNKERPTFTKGSEKFTYDTMRYNFRTKKAIVRNPRSQYGEGFVHSQQVKRNPDQSLYGYRNVYTTCALDTPHFGIRAKRIKVIPGRVIAAGASNIEVEGVATPLFLPFGIFPVSQKQTSGFVLPTYTVEQSRGLGLLNGGYYFNLGSHADLLLQTNIYTKGSYSISGLVNYKTIYRYSGGLSLSYAMNKTGEDYEPGASVIKDFMVNWRHQTDPKSRPGESFNASVTVGTSSFYANNSYNPGNILQNQYQSNISYSKNWMNKPFSLTVSALHNQSTQTREVSVTLPAINFHVTQINPFQSKRSIGSHWYDKVTFSYTFDELNRTTFIDTTFSLNSLSTRDFKTGFKHAIPISASYNVLRFVNMSFNVNYNEYWLTEKTFLGYNDATDKIDTNLQRGFYTARDFTTGVQFSTRIYGMKLFKNGKLRGIRHVLTPNVGFSYHPDFGAAPFNYYYQARLDSSLAISYLSPYQTSIIGMPPNGKAGNINMSLNNNLQIKVRSAKDTISGYKNVTLIDGFGISSAYNLAVDSFNWSNIGINFRTNILDKLNVSANATYDPYQFDYNLGRRTKLLMANAGNGIARFTNASLALGANFHSKPKNGGASPSNSEEYGRLVRSAYSEYVDFNIPWSMNISYSMNMNNNYSTFSKKDTLVLNHNVVFQGEVNLTERWKISVSSGYDFSIKQLSLTSIDIYRDLHCWQMHLQAIPFGPRKSYNFTLNVKATVLQDLKLLRRRDFRDAVN